MRPFRYQRAESTDAAVAAVAADSEAAFLGAGTNLVDLMKLGVATPRLLVDVSRLPLDEIVELPDGRIRIGAVAKNSDLAANPLIRQRYPMLTRAVLSGASGQIRNMATIGGNLLQRVRCPYFQDVTTPCNKRTLGDGCPAIEGHHREHAILGRSEHCIAVNASDMAVPLTALGAVVQVQGPEGKRAVPVPELYRVPIDRPDQDSILEHGELITAVDLPALPLARNSDYRKIRERASYAFALVSVAAALTVFDGTIREARVALGGVASVPWRATRAEAVLTGALADESSFMAAADAELAQASPLPGNAYKVAMARGALIEVLSALTSRQGI